VRLDPNAMGTIAIICLFGIAAAVGASMASSSSVSLAMVGGAAFASIVVTGRAIRRATGGVNGERLATSLPDEMRAALEAPGFGILATPPPMSDVVPHRSESDRSGACPRCASELGAESGAFRQRACAQGCGALILDSERLLVDRAGLDLEVVRAVVREQGVKKGVCPSCSSAMHEGRLRGVVVDLCLSCGALWLDKSELATLSREQAFTSGGPA
jgi:hypothetical protein